MKARNDLGHLNWLTSPTQLSFLPFTLRVNKAHLEGTSHAKLIKFTILFGSKIGQPALNRQ